MIHVHCRFLRSLAPGDVCAKEPSLNCSNEINVDETRQDELKLLLNFVAAGEVDNVVNVQSHRDWNSGILLRGIVSVVDVPRVNAGVVGVALESHDFQDLVNLDEPMAWAAADPVKCFLWEPELVILRRTIAFWGAHDGDFVRGEVAGVERILAVALLEHAAVLNRHADEETK